MDRTYNSSDAPWNVEQPEVTFKNVRVVTVLEKDGDITTDDYEWAGDEGTLEVTACKDNFGDPQKLLEAAERNLFDYAEMLHKQGDDYAAKLIRELADKCRGWISTEYYIEEGERYIFREPERKIKFD